MVPESLSINDLVQFIEDPAYIVDEKNCVIARNLAFEDLTNFAHDDIDQPKCYDVIGAVSINKKNCEEKICQKNCTYWAHSRTKHLPVRIKDAWINCNDKQGKRGKCNVDIHIFPFQTKDDQRIYSIHILRYRGARHSEDYYNEKRLRMTSATRSNLCEESKQGA